MKIKELHSDIERYLLEDCYCPHEIYSFDGFCYQLFYENQECEKLGEHKTDATQNIIACVAHPEDNPENKAQIILFFIENEKCIDSIRFDATENNIEITKSIIRYGIKNRKLDKKFDEYEPGSTNRFLNKIMAIADAVLIDA